MPEPLPQALYLHVPFCVRRCRYCDFATSAACASNPAIARHTHALESLTRRLADAGLFKGTRTAYVGGGTPTMAGMHLASLAGVVREACPALAEFSSEANPESLTSELAQALAAAGLTRISLGVQSLNGAELARLGRAHDAARARQAMASVRMASLDLSCDLMCGIPLQTPESWEASLAGVVEGGAEHVSCYPLMVEEGTPLYEACEAGREPWPDDDLQATLMEIAEHALADAGMMRYEVASYALPGRACAHNVAYWTGVPYLGLGPSAASMLSPEGFAALADAIPLACAPADDDTLQGYDTGTGDGPLAGKALAETLLRAGEEDVARVRLRMEDDARAFAEHVFDGTPLNVEFETLTRREALAEDLMLALRMSAGAPPRLLEEARACMGRELDAAVTDATSRGLARITDSGALAPTEQGWLLGNELYGAFWDLAGENPHS